MPGPIIPSSQGGLLATGEDAPTTRWMNPMWDEWFNRVAEASGGEMPVFAGGKALKGLKAAAGPSNTQLNALRQQSSLGDTPSPWS